MTSLPWGSSQTEWPLLCVHKGLALETMACPSCEGSLWQSGVMQDGKRPEQRRPKPTKIDASGCRRRQSNQTPSR